MRATRISLALAMMLAASACAREPQTFYMIDPATGQPVAAQQTYAPPQYAQQQTYQPPAQPQYPQPAYQPQYAQAQPYRAPAQPQYAQAGNRSLYSSSPASAQMAYGQPTYQPVYQPPPQRQDTQSGGRGLFTSSSGTRSFFAEAFAPAPQVVQPAPQYGVGGLYVPVQNGAYPAAPYPPR